LPREGAEIDGAEGREKERCGAASCWRCGGAANSRALERGAGE
jgi:hypothetical protein